MVNLYLHRKYRRISIILNFVQLYRFTSQSVSCTPELQSIDGIHPKHNLRKAIKPSKTLRISAMNYEQLVELQKMLTQFGAIESLDTSQVKDG